MYLQNSNIMNISLFSFKLRQRCAYGLVRFKNKKHLARVRKRSCLANMVPSTITAANCSDISSKIPDLVTNTTGMSLRLYPGVSHLQ